MGEYEESLEHVKNAPDNIFPDFLFNPVFNDFGDNYYQKSFANDELMAGVKKLRRRYGNYFQWAEAMDIYNEYMDKLVDKYGSMRVIKNALHYDMMPDPVPAKPKLKNNRKNRQFLQGGVIPSEKIEVEPLTRDEQLEIIRAMIPNAMGDGVNEADSKEKLPKEMRKRVARLQQEMAGRHRRQNLYRSTGSNVGTDFIVEYLNQAKRGTYDHSGNYTGEDNMSLAEIVKEQELLDTTREELLEDPAESTTVIKNGRLVNKREEQRMEIYKQLYENGIDVIGAFGSSMSKKAVKMVRSYIGDTEPATKKELKKIRKRARKEQERLVKRRDNDQLLEQTLLGSKFSLSDNGESLSFRLKDVYPD